MSYIDRMRVQVRKGVLDKVGYDCAAGCGVKLTEFDEMTLIKGQPYHQKCAVSTSPVAANFRFMDDTGR